MKLGLKRDEVKLVPFDEEWRFEFNHIKKLLIQKTRLEGSRIEHIGSTAIKGMMAKPIIDIAVGVDNLGEVDERLIAGLKEIGFLRLRVERPGEIVFAKFTDKTYETKTHFIHMMEFHSDLWLNLIFFRDYLNTNMAKRNEYMELKKHFISHLGNEILAYTDYKESFVKDIYSLRLNESKQI